MKRSAPARRPARRAAAATLNARTALLAGVGAVILGRRQIDVAGAEIAAIPARARAGAEAAAAVLRSEIRRIEREAKSKLAPVSTTVERLIADAGRYGQQAQGIAAQRLNPLLDKANLPLIPYPRKPTAKRPVARKPSPRKVAGKPAARKTVRKAA